MTSPQGVLVQRGEQVFPRRSRGAWRCARTDGEAALLVSFMGSPIGFPPGAAPLYVASARVVGSTLLVSVAPSAALVPLLRRKRAAGRVGVLRVQVDGGWRGREILDAADGRRRAVFDGAALLRARTSTARADDGIGDDRPSWFQRCVTTSGAEVLLVHADESAEPVTFAGQRTSPIPVRGRTGVALEERDGRRLESRGVWWSERGATVSVRSMGRRGPGSAAERGIVTIEELVAFADALV